jgi:hypothetical protein
MVRASGLVTSAPANQTKTSRVLSDNSLGVVGHGRPGQHCLSHARAIDVAQLSAVLATRMEVDIEDRPSPFGGGLRIHVPEQGRFCRSQELAPVERDMHMNRTLYLLF